MRGRITCVHRPHVTLYMSGTEVAFELSADVVVTLEAALVITVGRGGV